jgi:hypothetical protein
MVIKNKEAFQAGLSPVMLGQSQCNEHSYACWLYGVPLIVSTNDWMVGAKPHDQKWLDANSAPND